jgi:PAS domain S-box-containing protein
MPELMTVLLVLALLLGAMASFRIWRLRAQVKQLRRTAAESEERYNVLTDNVAAAVILHEPSGVVLWCSPYTEVLTGYSLSEIYAERDSFLTAHAHEADLESIRNALGIVASGEPFQYRYRFYHKSGLCLWLETRTVPVIDRDSPSDVALSIILDVTASVHGQLKVEERNRDLNEFTYMVSHDLKAPIVTLRGMLEIVQEEAKQKQVREILEPTEHMGKAIKRLEDLVEGVLELARVSTTERELSAVSLKTVMAEVLEDYRWRIDQVAAEVSVEGPLPWVFGNKTQLYQIFANLVGNALKYRAQSRPATVVIRVSDATSRRRAVIEVRDNGRGIAPEFRESIFKPFARAGETAIEGSGVGLAAVKRILEKIGGSITVDSVVGEGSTFTVELRRAIDAEKAEQNEQAR